MKQLILLISIILGFSLAGCNSSTDPKIEEENNNTLTNQTLKTSMGDLIISDIQLADEVHNQQPPAGQKFLLLTLAKSDLQPLDPATFSLETFQTMMQENSGKIYINGNSDTQFISTMAGWVEDDFMVGFLVDESNSYTLYWPDNPTINLVVDN